ncbi:MAG: hypothetical protein AB7I18_09760 [Candidatus Berkiella sp.]
MLLSARSRFISEQAVKKSLTNNVQLPAKMNANLCAKLGLPENTIVENLSKVNTRGVGATQCRPYIVTLKGGVKLFLKLSPRNKNSIIEQAKADQNIQAVLGKNPHPFITMMPNSGVPVSENGTHNEMLFFPFVPGDNLFITMTYRNPDHSAAMLQFADIGKCLANMHIQCMKLSGTYDQFIQEGCVLSKVLIHDDWQSTNLMITPENKAIIIDTEGTSYSGNKPYRNIAESWELSGKDAALMTALLDAYINEFDPDLQPQVRESVTTALLQQHGLAIEELKRPVPNR